MYKYTNTTGISPALSIFLLHDEYAHVADPYTISATSLLKPLRQLALMQQASSLDKEIDISNLVASSMGSALHDRCEKAWASEETVKKALDLWGFPKEVRDRIKINPTELKPRDIPIYVEQRVEKKYGKFTVTGKYDLIMDGTLNDYKSTSVWSYIYDSNAENYSLQGSIYKALNPDKIRSDYININYIFTDWSKTKARADSQYPASRVLTKRYPLLSIKDTEEWIENKLSQLESLLTTPQELLPECSEEELWATPTVHKYYQNAAKTTRATKVFTNMDEALARQATDGGKGTIITTQGGVKACIYCPVVDICTQAARLKDEGRLLFD